MKSALKPALENLEKALEGLETALDKRFVKEKDKPKKAAVRDAAVPQLALARNENEINRKIAAKLDQTILRLESLLCEEE
jgi:hypothetical protein